MDSASEFDHKVRTVLLHYRKVIVWLAIGGFCVWLITQVQEVFLLLMLSYGISLLLDPIVSWLGKWRIPRGTALLIIFLTFLFLVIAGLSIAVPSLVREYSVLVDGLPEYLRVTYGKINTLLIKWRGKGLPEGMDVFVENLRQRLSALGPQHIKAVIATLGDTLLKGYSVTLTVLNLLMLPFFVFYLTRDLKSVHKFIGNFFDPESREVISEVGGEILDHIYTFFKGQMTVAIIMMVLYVTALSVVRLPFALVVGCITGALGIVPYLGVATGLVLATIITLVNDPSVSSFLWVYGAFLVCSGLEGAVITPKIVGKSMGIHPLGVMIALIIGGQLCGLLGLILAVPAAAALRVCVRRLFVELDEAATVG